VFFCYSFLLRFFSDVDHIQVQVHTFDMSLSSPKGVQISSSMSLVRCVKKQVNQIITVVYTIKSHTSSNLILLSHI